MYVTQLHHTANKADHSITTVLNTYMNIQMHNEQDERMNGWDLQHFKHTNND